MKLSKHRQRFLCRAAAVAGLVAMAVACRVFARATDNVFADKLANDIRVFLYFGLFAVWGVAVRRRVVQAQVRHYLIAVSVLMVSWLTVRECKWHLVQSDGALRALWYSYHIFMLFIPLLALFVSLSLGKPELYRLPKRTALLYAPTVCLILLVLTNDLHQLVFRFPADAVVWQEQHYEYGPGFYLSAAWGIGCSIAAFAIMLARCRLPNRGKFLWLPLLPFGAAVLYAVLYAMGVPIVHSLLDDVTVSECLMFAGFFECCIQCGLIQSNTRYSALFRASVDISAQITDNDYEVRFAASGAEPVPREEMRRAEAAPFLMAEGKRLNNMPVNGGHVIWTEDISELLALRDKLEIIQEELSDRNEILRQEYAEEKERVTVEEQNRLYDLLQRNTQAQLDQATRLAAAYQSAAGPEEKREILARIVVLGSYIKRRKDFSLSLESAPSMQGRKLESAFGESFRSLALLSIRGGYYVDAAQEQLPGALLVRAYDFFEDVLEAVLDTARNLNVRVSSVRGSLRCGIETDGRADAAALARKYPAMRCCDDEDGSTEYLLPLEGGDAA